LSGQEPQPNLQETAATKCTKWYKCLHHTQPVSVMGSPSHKGSLFLMLTKFFTCLSCHRKQRRWCFRYSTELYGQEQSLQVRLGAWCPLLSVWRNWDHGTLVIRLWTLLANLQLTPPLYSSSYSGCHYLKSPDPISSRD
jgi:hypothetical protein